MAAPGAVPLQLVQVTENEQGNSSDTKRKNRKYRYKKLGYHKTERESARRIEARNFLSGITLDSHYRTPVEVEEQEPLLLHDASIHGGSTIEDAVLSKTELPQADAMAVLYELYNRHSPVKVPQSKSHDIGFEYLMHAHHLVNRSSSLVESVSTPTPEHKKFPHIAHTKSLGSSVGMGSSLETGGIRYLNRVKEFPVDSRYGLL